MFFQSQAFRTVKKARFCLAFFYFQKKSKVFKKAKLATLLQSKQKYNGCRCGQRSTTTGDYYITHSMHVQDVLHTARRCNNLDFGFI